MTVAQLKAIRDRMAQAAKAHGLVYYGELMDLVGLNRDYDVDRHILGTALAAINDIEMAAGRPALSSVAVAQLTDFPSRGYFEYLDGLNLRQPGEADLALFSRMVALCHACTTW